METYLYIFYKSKYYSENASFRFVVSTILLYIWKILSISIKYIDSRSCIVITHNDCRIFDSIDSFTKRNMKISVEKKLK